MEAAARHGSYLPVISSLLFVVTVIGIVVVAVLFDRKSKRERGEKPRRHKHRGQ